MLEFESGFGIHTFRNLLLLPAVSPPLHSVVCQGSCGLGQGWEPERRKDGLASGDLGQT